MRIGLWSDSVNFPSLPLMKISAYHKSLNDSVSFVDEGGHYDKVYLSKVFNIPTLKKIPQSPPLFEADEVCKGGTGYAIDVINGIEIFDPKKHKDLPDIIERQFPDYSLYPQYSEAYGFLTRGCCNNCSFCIVCPKEGRGSRQVADLSDFWNGQRVIRLMDPNLLACPQREALLTQLQQSGARVDFTQGLDARLVNEDVMRQISQIKVQSIHFAFDLMKNEQSILRGLRCFCNHWEGDFRRVYVYVLTNYNTSLQEDWYRVKTLRDMGMFPYIMIYQKGTHPRFLTDLARWCNNPRLYRSSTFEDYVPRVDGKSCRELYNDILKGVI